MIIEINTQSQLPLYEQLRNQVESKQKQRTHDKIRTAVLFLGDTLESY